MFAEGRAKWYGKPEGRGSEFGLLRQHREATLAKRCVEMETSKFYLLFSIILFGMSECSLLATPPRADTSLPYGRLSTAKNPSLFYVCADRAENALQRIDGRRLADGDVGADLAAESLWGLMVRRPRVFVVLPKTITALSIMSR